MSTWGILGCGTIANEMAATFQKMGHEIYGVANRTPEKAEKFADKYGVKHVFETYEEMLADENIDIIYVATPHSMHYENMKQAVNAGKHILCEKAITVNVAQLEEVLELAEEKGVVVREAMTISHMPLYKKLKERIKEGAIGNTKMVQVNFGSNKGYDSTQRFFALEAAGGALLDIGVYATAFARTFLSEMPNTILTTVEYLETGADEQSGIIMKNTKGEMVVMCLTLRALPAKTEVDSIHIFHQFNGCLFSDILIESAAEIIGNVVFSIRKCTGSAESTHDGAAFAVNTGLDFITINGTFTVLQRMSYLKNSDL